MISVNYYVASSVQELQNMYYEPGLEYRNTIYTCLRKCTDTYVRVFLHIFPICERLIQCSTCVHWLSLGVHPGTHESKVCMRVCKYTYIYIYIWVRECTSAGCIYIRRLSGEKLGLPFWIQQNLTRAYKTLQQEIRYKWRLDLATLIIHRPYRNKHFTVKRSLFCKRFAPKNKAKRSIKSTKR